ncbi:hypothetical protein [Glycomyces sp. NPDC021274]|uniref:hypothetical protein n=1 Tax=Glycomyces sp. NPDC021274 TaxID=3155120 RepID=UPI0033CE0A19
MTISPEDQALIEQEASAHLQFEPWYQARRPIPKSVNRVDGCDCGGIQLHRVDCTITSLDREQALANIDAANERSAAYCAEITRIRNSTHRVSWEALFVDMGPSGTRMFDTRVPTGACELTCTCDWSTIVPVDQVDAIIAEHEGQWTNEHDREDETP